MRIPKLSPGSFMGNVAMLVGWTAVAQAIYLLATPIISRLFTVEDFGRLAVIQTVGSFLLILAGLRYEASILLPDDDEDAVNLLALTASIIVISTIITVCLGLSGCFQFISHRYLAQTRFNFIADVWWLIPLYQLGGTSNELLTNWAVRQKDFTTIAKTKIAQSLSIPTFQIGLGYIGASALGLYIGDVFGRVAGVTTLFTRFIRNDKHLLSKVTATKMLVCASRYKSFPLFSTFAGLISVAARLLPNVLILGLCGPFPAGSFNQATRVLAVPMELISRAYTQVYLAEGAQLAREDPVKLKRLFIISARRLLSVSLVPVAIIAIFGPQLFGFVFGSKWIEAGIFARYMSVMLMFNFVTFSLAHTLNILERQSWQLAWDSMSFIVGSGGIVAMHRLGYSAGSIILVYGLSMAIIHILNILLCLHAINLHIKKHNQQRLVYG